MVIGAPTARPFPVFLLSLPHCFDTLAAHTAQGRDRDGAQAYQRL